MVELLHDLKDEFIVIQFNTRTGGGDACFPAGAGRLNYRRDPNDNGVRRQGSSEIMKNWNAKSSH